MWSNLFGTENYEGSKLEQLILTQQKLLDHVDQVQTETFATAMLSEHRATMEQFSHIRSGGSELPEYFASKLLASCFLRFMTVASKAAHAYGLALKRMRETDPLSSIVLVNCLALYAVMSDLTATQAQGGYRKWFGAYLLFRWSMGKAGLIAPWQKLLENENLGEFDQDTKSFLLYLFSEDFTNKALRLLPTDETEEFVLYAHSITDFDPRTASRWNQIPAALGNPKGAVEGLLAPILAPVLGGLVSRAQSNSHTAVFPASDWSHQMAINSGFTAFKP